MEIKILRGGMLTTVQDLGRRGRRAAGVPWSGAMDAFALRIANALVGNADDAAALEVTLTGPEVEFSADGTIAIGGAECEGLPAWKPIGVRAGERVKFGECRNGCRAYLAVAGGIEVEPVLGSRSTFLRGGFGGFEGRALREGDVLRAGTAAWTAASAAIPEMTTATGNWRIDPRILPAYSAAPTVRVLRGAQAGEFGPEFFAREFKVSAQSDRMGLRLAGEALGRSSSDELVSSAVLPGVVQVPPDGQPLVLMADAQTIGGYPQIATVIGVDLPLVAQLRPGDAIRFCEVTREEAQRLARLRERNFRMLHEGLAQKLGAPST